MNNRRKQQGFSTALEFFQDLFRLVGVMILPQRLAPLPDPARRRVVSGMIRRTPSGRLTGWLFLLVGLALFAAVPAWAGQAALPAGVPNIFDPEVRAQYQAVSVGNLRGNSDFPVVLLVNTSDEQPQAILLGLDARNGKDTWSLRNDPIILIMVFSDSAAIEELYVDTGFADGVNASGIYGAVDDLNSSALPDLLGPVTAAGTRTYM